MGNQVPLFENFSCDPLFLYEAVVNSTDDYVFVVDLTTDLALISDNMYVDFDLPGRLTPGLVPVWGTLIHEKDRAGFFASMDSMVCGDENAHRMEYQVLNRYGEYVWVVCRGLLQRDAAGCPLTFAGTVTNLSVRGKVDHVTGLFTQMECERRMPEMLEREGYATLLLLGLDNFTKINDLRGHAFGDAVLRKFAQEVQSLLPPEAGMYRFDGDEFAVVYRGDAVDKLGEIFKQIQLYCCGEHAIDGVQYFCSVSGGLAGVGQDGGRYAELIQYAASALEDAKTHGKNCCLTFCSDSILPKLYSLELLEELRASVFCGFQRFEVVYQPFVNAETLALTGAEALLRWSRQKGESVSPVEFIPLLESADLMIPVGRWVLEQALRQGAFWREKCPDFVLNVNVSFLQMKDPSFVSLVMLLLKETGFDPAHLVLELTEGRFVTDRELLLRCFRSLRELGIRIAMDDFGTGYSSLGMLYQCPADIVKIDRVFIDKIDDQDHSFNFAFIQAVIRLCHNVGILVCVEGVEKEGELNAVRSMSADSIQGFYVARPLHPKMLEEQFLL